MNKKKSILFIVLYVIIIMIGMFIIKVRKQKYSIDALVDDYNLKNVDIENEYLDYLKGYIYPVKLRMFIENSFVPTSLLGGNDTGENAIDLMKEIGYELLFTSLFDKACNDFEDCPVTAGFRNKYNTNLFDYFNLAESNDCEIICSQNSEGKNITVKVFGNFENTEPTYWITHHFRYILDDEGNVDDIILDRTDKS